MDNVLNSIFQFISDHSILFKILSMLAAGFIISWFVVVLYLRLKPRFEKTQRVWDDTLFDALEMPLLVFIWLFTASFIFPLLVYELQLPSLLIKYINEFRKLLFILFLLWFLFRYIRNLEFRVYEYISVGKVKEDKTSVRAIAQFMRVLVAIIGILFILQSLGMSITTLLAASGIGGIALGFAAKDTLANFIEGMMIFWDRPFSVGDWIRSPDREFEGTVEYIGWRLTRIRTFDKRALYVPNGVFATVSIENPSRMTHRRIKATIGLRYDDASKIAVILKDIESMLRDHSEIDAEEALIVNLFEFGPSSLNFVIYAFTKSVNLVKFQAIQQDVFLKVIDIINKHGAECAFPTTTIHIPEEILIKNKQEV